MCKLMYRECKFVCLYARTLGGNLHENFPSPISSAFYTRFGCILYLYSMWFYTRKRAYKLSSQTSSNCATSDAV